MAAIKCTTTKPANSSQLTCSNKLTEWWGDDGIIATWVCNLIHDVYQMWKGKKIPQNAITWKIGKVLNLL